MDISDFPTRHNYVLGLFQKHIERILAEWVSELAVPIYREREVTGFRQDDEGVDVAVSDDDSLRAEYVVGCDGGRSVIRKAAGIEFPGRDATMSWLMVEAEMSEEPAFGFRQDAIGTHGIGKAEGEGRVQAVVTERQLVSASEPTLRDVSDALIAVYGTDFGIASGPLRVFSLLHRARPVLLNLAEPVGFDCTSWADRVQVIDAEYAGAWELPAIGAVTAPTAVLIRPDGYVAWVGDRTELGLADALTTWFGVPTAALRV